jgi:ABC-type spermidine/putrescine transport system permease subunit II
MFGEQADPGLTAKRGSGVDRIMPLLQMVIALIVVGVLLWLVNSFIPMQRTIKSILNAVVIIAVVLWLLNVFGRFHSLSRIHIGA